MSGLMGKDCDYVKLDGSHNPGGVAVGHSRDRPVDLAASESLSLCWAVMHGCETLRYMYLLYGKVSGGAFGWYAPLSFAHAVFMSSLSAHIGSRTGV